MMRIAVRKARLGFVFLSIAAMALSGTVLAYGPGDGKRLLGLPVVSEGDAAPGTASRVDLGRKLFLDKNLSADRTISCESCHLPDMAFADGKSVAEGTGGRKGARNAPTLINAGFGKSFFWEGRRETLEAQVLDPLFNPNEHRLRDEQDLLERVRSDASYSLLPDC